jgi:hypothetical protein
MNAANPADAAAIPSFTSAMPAPRPVAVSAEPAAATAALAAALAAADAADAVFRGSQAVPILPSADLDRALACYRYLGFALLGRASDYLRLSLGPVELHLYLEPALDPLRNSAGCYLRVADPAALRKAWDGDGVNCLDLPGIAAYGTSLFAVIDSDGNTLRIGPLRQDSEHRA